MKKYIFILAISIGMILSACGTKSGSTTKETKDSTKVQTEIPIAVPTDSTTALDSATVKTVL